MSGIINIILGAVILFLVVVAFLWVSTKHKESGLGDTCSETVHHAVHTVKMRQK